MWLLANGVHPSRLDSPRMDDGIWNLIERCWSSDPSQRPSMEQVVTTYLTHSPSLLADLITEVCASEPSTINVLLLMTTS